MNTISRRQLTFRNISGAEVRGLAPDTWVIVDVELREDEKGIELSICGSWGIGRRPGSDREMYGAGQCVEKIVAAFPYIAPYVRWHLNGLHAGCVHQRALGWKPCPGHYGPDARPCDGARPLNAAERIKNFSGWSQPNTRLWRCRADKVGKPCPECDYCYGTAWLFEPLPPEVIDWAKTFGNAR